MDTIPRKRPKSKKLIEKVTICIDRELYDDIEWLKSEPRNVEMPEIIRDTIREKVAILKELELMNEGNLGHTA